MASLPRKKSSSGELNSGKFGFKKIYLYGPSGRKEMRPKEKEKLVAFEFLWWEAITLFYFAHKKSQ